MTLRSTPAAVLALAVAGTACSPPTQEIATLSQEDMTAIAQASESSIQGALAGNFDAWAAAYAADAILMPPSAPVVQGHADMKAWKEAGPTFTSFSANRLDITGLGDLAYVRGTFSFVAEVTGVPEPIEGTGKYLEIWRRQPDGSWACVIDIWNSNSPNS